MKKPTVAVIFGSRSAEHDVSIVTALASIIKPLELSKKYQIVPVYISKDGRWFCDNKLKNIELFTSGKIDEFLQKSKPAAIQFNGKMTVLIPGVRNKLINIDAVFPATHGTYGENGDLMGLLEMANVPYVGCDVPSSAISMDKVLSKLMAQAHGISTPKFHYFSKPDFQSHAKERLDAIKKNLKFPVFVKPAHLGSSIGITRVSDKDELENAIEVALHYDDKALVEEGVQNLIEVTVPVMGNSSPRVAMVEQPLTSPEDFFDFETKYMQGGKKGKSDGGKNAKLGAQGYSKIPADISKDLYKKSEETALGVYKAIGCTGIARVDLLIDSKANKIYFNEINPLPGSLYSHNWQKAGVSSVQLVTNLVDLAFERYEQKQHTNTTFSTNYLKQF